MKRLPEKCSFRMPKAHDFEIWMMSYPRTASLGCWSFALSLSLISTTHEVAAASEPPVMMALRTDAAPRIDGKLNEAGWAAAPVVNSFTQRDPNDGRPSSKTAAVRMLYDDEALYVGARIDGPGPVTYRLGRRDMVLVPSDWFRISLDTFRDRRSAMRFDVNPGGVQRDALISGDPFQETGLGRDTGSYRFAGDDGEVGWDAVWDAATSVDEKGWTVEVRIPLSQLRFANDKPGLPPGAGKLLNSFSDGSLPEVDRGWGVQFEVIDAQRQELSMFSYRSKKEPGGVAAFARLDGLHNLQARRPLELIPYVVSQGTFDSATTNRLKKSEEYEFKGGLDLRYRLTSNLTLAAALNPDFGQVEVDPAVINLTSFETKLEERRPFFLEGVDIFGLAPSLRSRNAARELLYPRRIGRAPQLRLPSTTTDVPVSTRILGAAKITGRTTSGWKLGVLDAYTDEEQGTYLDATGTHQALVEPRTNYFAGRMIREVRSGQTAVGVIGTAVNRSLGDPRAAAVLAKSAYTGGVDFGTDFFGRVWNVSGYFAGSRVQGTPAAITALQRTSSRYYQRPDAESFHLDPNATTISGASGQVQISKQTGTHWTGNVEYAVIAPGYEINDIGFQQRVDRRGLSGRLTWSERTPGTFLRRMDFTLNPTLYTNFDGDWLDKNLRLRANFRHLNYWGLDIESDLIATRMDDRLTRGGPVAEAPAVRSLLIMLLSDRRKAVRGSLDFSMRSEDSRTRTHYVAATLDLQAARNWNLSLSPRVDWIRQDAQYMGTVTDPLATSTYGRRYVFGQLDQKEASISGRLNYAFNARLTLEVYTQALISNAAYGTPREFLRPREFKFGMYGRELGSLAKNGTSYRIDPDGAGPAPAFNLADPSFTNRSLRANAVLRWEYRPGSTLFLVWQQERSAQDAMRDFTLGRAASDVMTLPARNILAVKASYWFNP
jgi:hypothetical protein